MLRSFFLVAAVTALPAIAEAQGTTRPQVPTIPQHMVPPAGKCRIWMEGVPAAQQPAPTDCQTALRQKPTNGIVVFGPTERELEASGFSSHPRGSAVPASARSDTVKVRAPRRPESAP
jgi:hypothetical protein